jgi:hypothetical protein
VTFQCQACLQRDRARFHFRLLELPLLHIQPTPSSGEFSLIVRRRNCLLTIIFVIDYHRNPATSDRFPWASSSARIIIMFKSHFCRQKADNTRIIANLSVARHAFPRAFFDSGPLLQHSFPSLALSLFPALQSDCTCALDLCHFRFTR